MDLIVTAIIKQYANMKASHVLWVFMLPKISERISQAQRNLGSLQNNHGSWRAAMEQHIQKRKHSLFCIVTQSSEEWVVVCVQWGTHGMTGTGE